MLVFFGYTHCPDVCPTTLADWGRARRALAGDTSRVRFLFVSVDPDRDPPDSAAAYARRFDPAIVGVSGSAAQIAEVTGAWGVAAMPDASGDSAHAGMSMAATMSHTARTFVVDPDGRLRLVFASDARPDDVAADVRALL